LIIKIEIRDKDPDWESQEIVYAYSHGRRTLRFVGENQFVPWELLHKCMDNIQEAIGKNPQINTEEANEGS